MMDSLCRKRKLADWLYPVVVAFEDTDGWIDDLPLYILSAVFQSY